MREIKKPPREKGGRITSKATDKRINYDNNYGKLAFSSACDKHCLLSSWQSRELDELIGYFKLVEKLLWKEIIMESNGLDYEEHHYIALPKPHSLPPDTSLHSMRVTQRMRVFGYRTQDFFNIIWFDRNHIVCPVDKPKEYVI